MATNELLHKIYGRRLGITSRDELVFDDEVVSVGGDTDDVSAKNVTAAGSTAARTLAGRFSDRPIAEDWEGAEAGNASVDSVVGIQAGIDAIAAAGGGKLYLRSGVYYCSVAPQIPSEVRLIGAGRDATEIRATGSDPSILRTKVQTTAIVNAGAEHMTLRGTAAQLYGLYGSGSDGGTWENISVAGLSAVTGAGWDASFAAWGFYFVSYDASGTIRPNSNNYWSRLQSADSPNGFTTASRNGVAIQSGLNNLLMRSYFSGFTLYGVDIWGEAMTLIAVRANSGVDNLVVMRFNDAVTTVIACDADCSFDAGAPPGTDAWGLPAGTKNNSSTGMYFADTCSAVVINPTGNGCAKRVDFQSITAFNKVQLIRQSYNKLTPLVAGGLIAKIVTKTADHTLTMEDGGATIRMNLTGTANNLTAPPMADVKLPIGTRVEVVQYGTGVTTLVEGAGVTIQRKAGLVFSARYGTAWLRKVLDDVWIGSGDLT